MSHLPRSAIPSTPPSAPHVDPLREGSTSRSRQGDSNALRASTITGQEHQTPTDSLPPIGLPNALGSVSTSRKRKAKEPLQQSQDQPTSTTVRSELEWARYNNMQEADAVFNSQQVRRANLQPRTIKAYDSYRERWFEWCQANHYRDFSVTTSRATRYFQEMFSEPDPLRPEIKPLRRQKARNDELADYLMPETMDFYIKSVVDLWNEQATSAPSGVHPGAEVSPRKIARPFMEAYKRKIGSLTKASKFKGLRITDGYNKQGFKRMMKSYWTRNYVQADQKNRRKLNGLRDRLNLSWSHFMMCRGENMRMALLQDLNFHAFEFSDDTGQFTLGVVLTMLQGKMNTDGKMLYGVVVRNKDVEVCPVGSLAFYLFELFMEPQLRPDFSKPDWTSNYLVFASSPDQPMSSAAHYSAQKKEMQAANIVSSKVTHAGRRAGAQAAQSAGATIEEIAQHCNWLHQRVATHYLSEIPERVPLKLAGFVHHQERFWLARNTIIPPVELQKLIFPEINDAYPDDDWQVWMENIMTGKDEYDNRQLDQRLAAKYPQEEYQKIKFFILLVHLRKVILQDAVALMDTNGDPQCQYDFHRMFQEPVFRSALFLKFRADLRLKMSTTRSPISDSLLANAPALHHSLREISERVATVIETLRTVPSTSDMDRDREIWSASIARQVDLLSSQFVTMHNSLVSANNAMSGNFAIFHRTFEQLLANALKTVSNVEISRPEIPLLPPHVLFMPPMMPRSLQHSSSLLVQPQSSSSATHSRQSIRSPPPPASPPLPTSPPPASPPSASPPPASPPLPAAPPPVSPQLLPQQLQPSGAAPLPTTTHPTIVDLHALAEELAWPRTKPSSPNYVMQPRPSTLQALWREWFHGVDGGPSIWQMDKYYKWRLNGGTAVRKQYSFSRAIILSVLRAISEATESSLELKKEAGIRTVNLRIARAGSLNKYFLELSRNKGKIE